MKIAIPVDESKKDVCVSFGRAPFFMLHDTQSGTTQYIANTAADAQSGAGLKAAQLIVDNKANVLLTVRCGQNAADVLVAANIQVYKTSGSTAEDNCRDFAEGKLPVMTQFHAGFHGHQ